VKINQPNVQRDEVMGSSRTAIESILIWSAGRIGNLKTCSALYRIVVKIQIRALVKAVVNGLRRRLIEIGMNICKATPSQDR
jgi:hypothetical protein